MAVKSILKRLPERSEVVRVRHRVEVATGETDRISLTDQRVEPIGGPSFHDAGGGIRTRTPPWGHLILSQARLTTFATPARQG